MSKGKRKNSSKNVLNGAKELLRVVDSEGGTYHIGKMYQTGNNNRNGRDIKIKILGEMSNNLELKLHDGKNFQEFRITAPTEYKNAREFLSYCMSKTRTNYYKL